MEAKDKITKAKVQLVLNQPFYATLALGFKYLEDSTIETGNIDGVTMRYNPEWINSLTLKQTVGFIAHEVSHIAYLHHTRQNSREHEKWNTACDYAINQLLKDAGFELPDGGLIDSAYKDMSAEDIYNKLPTPPKDNSKNQGQGKGNGQGKPGSDPGRCGGVKPAPAKTQSEMNQIEAETKQLVAQAATVAKQQGKLPAHLERLIEEMLQPKINWKDVLNSFLTEVTRNDYTFAQPSKRYLSQGLYLPSLRSIEKGKFVLIIDTSGSIDLQLLNQFAGEMQSILSDVAESITVYYVDTKVNRIQEFESDETLEMTAMGGGGTDFKPAFDHMNDNGIDCAAAIYFTDGCCNSFPKDPCFPVLWATYDNKKFIPPFGEVVHVD
jgi:predicted metal-dependent peptidase